MRAQIPERGTWEITFDPVEAAAGLSDMRTARPETFEARLMERAWSPSRRFPFSDSFEVTEPYVRNCSYFGLPGICRRRTDLRVQTLLVEMGYASGCSTLTSNAIG